MIIMLIYFINRRNIIIENTQNVTSSTEIAEFESLKRIIKKLSESQSVAVTTKCVSSENFDFKNEDAEAYCITSIKNLLRTVEPNILSTILNSTTSDLPLLKCLLHYGHHTDVMIRNAAKISLMSVFQKCDDQAVFGAVSDSVSDILKHAKKAALAMQDYNERSNIKAMKAALRSYQEEFEYIDDILKLNLKNKNIIMSQIMRNFIVPFIFNAIIDDQQDYISPLCRRIGLYLLSTLLESITDSDMNGWIMKILLHQRAMPADLKLKEQQINKNLVLILLKEKTNIDTLLVLNIYHSLQNFTLETKISRSEGFYHKFIFVCMELLKTNYQSNPFIESLKLKLLISILQPLIQRNCTCNSNLIKLKDLYLRNLQNLYEEIRIKISPKISFVIDIIDEQYEIFTQTNMYRGQVIIDKNLLKGRIAIYRMMDNIKLELYHLFCIRFLYFELKGEKEKCLPLIKKKEEIGKTVAIDNSLLCKKFIGETLYQKDHFVKMTDRQLLILQSTEKKMDGVVIFNPYYKDIVCSVNKNNVLKLSDVVKTSTNECGVLSKEFSICIKFQNTDNLKFLTDTLNRAKESQLKTAQEKLKEITIGKA